MVVYDRSKRELVIPIGWGVIEDKEIDYSTLPLGARILDGEGYFFVQKNTNTPEAVPDCSFYYSKNGGDWINIDNTHPDEKIPVSKGDIINFKGYNKQYATSEQNGTNIVVSGASWELQGNIMSLCYGEDFSGVTEHNYSAVFGELFRENGSLVSAEHLVLPLLEVPDYGYGSLFAYCGGLKKAPYLPATKIGFRSYTQLFTFCPITEVRCALNPQYAGRTSTLEWLIYTSNTGTFYGKDVENWPTGNDGIPEGWERVEI